MICQTTKLDHQRLLQLLQYDENSGLFHWEKDGRIAGGLTSNGYIVIGVDGVLFLAHRLAWFYVYGTWPKLKIDHIDRKKTNNRINNLREATSSQNAVNAELRITNKSGFKGVCWDRKNKKWRATITVNRKQISLGRHCNLEDAVYAYEKEAKAIYGEFAI